MSKTKTIPVTFRDRLRLRNVKRWHIINTTRDQTVAEHSYLVWVIAEEIGLRIGLTQEDFHKLWVLALTHDEHEVFLGDMPTPAKEYLAVDDPREPMSMRFYMSQDSKLESIVKAADTLEAYWFLRENGVGFRAAQVADELHERCLTAMATVTGNFPACEVPALIELLTESYEGKMPNERQK